MAINTSFYGFYGGKRGISGSIAKTYISIEAMREDFAKPNCQVGIGEMVMIDVQVNGVTSIDAQDTGKLFVREIDGPRYITDLSGPTGKTPMIGVGEVLAPEGDLDKNNEIIITATDYFDKDSGDYNGSNLNFTIPVPTIDLEGQTGKPGSEVTITRIVKDGQTTDDTKFNPYYLITIPRGWTGIGAVSAAIKASLKGDEMSHLILDYVDPSYPDAPGSVPPYSQDLGLIKTIEKIEINKESDLICYFSDHPATPVVLGTLRFVTDFNKEVDYPFGANPENWENKEGLDNAKVYVKYSDTGDTKHYIGTMRSIVDAGTIVIPRDASMEQYAIQLVLAFADGTIKNLGDIRGRKGDPGDPIQVHQYFTSYEDMVANADTGMIAALQLPGAEMVTLYFYDRESSVWRSLGTISVQEGAGTNIIVQTDEPLAGVQSEGDIWFILE